MLHTVCYSPEPLITMFVYSFFKHKFKLKIQRKEIINKTKNNRNENTIINNKKRHIIGERKKSYWKIYTWLIAQFQQNDLSASQTKISCHRWACNINKAIDLESQTQHSESEKKTKKRVKSQNTISPWSWIKQWVLSQGGRESLVHINQQFTVLLASVLAWNSRFNWVTSLFYCSNETHGQWATLLYSY